MLPVPVKDPREVHGDLTPCCALHVVPPSVVTDEDSRVISENWALIRKQAEEWSGSVTQESVSVRSDDGLTLRGAYVAVSARTRFHAVLAMGISLMLALRTLASMLSAFGFLPVTAPAPPLLTLSLPSLCAQLFLIGMLCGISGRNDADLAEDAHLAMLAK